MDHKFEFVSQVDIKGLLERSVIATNVTVQKWRTTNKIKANDISSVEVKSILFGFIRKYIVKDNYDFKRFRGLLNISLDGGTKYITSVKISDTSSKHFREKYIMHQLEKDCEKINYISLFPKEDIKLENNSEKITKDLIDFSRIESIKF